MTTYMQPPTATTPYSFPLTPPVSLYGHPACWKGASSSGCGDDDSTSSHLPRPGMEHVEDDGVSSNVDNMFGDDNDACGSVPSLTASSALSTAPALPALPLVDLGSGLPYLTAHEPPVFMTATYAASQPQPMPTSTSSLTAVPPTALPVMEALQIQPAAPLARSDSKGKAKMDMNLVPATSEPATAGFATPLAGHVATLAVWIWYAKYPSSSTAPVGSKPSIPTDSLEFEGESQPINPLQLNPTPDFIARVARILQVTMVSHSVVVIALLYIYRFKRINPIMGGAGSEYKPFIASLILSNKFLDDNTYTNKTWSELTQLSLKDIGEMEIEFLRGLNYTLKVEHADYLQWRHNLDGFMLGSQRRRRFAQLHTPLYHFSPGQSIEHLLSPLPPLQDLCLPRAQTASPPYVAPPLTAAAATASVPYAFPPASPSFHARKRSADAAFTAAGPTPDSSAIYEAMRQPARKGAYVHVQPFPTLDALASLDSTRRASVQDAEGSSRRSASLTRRIARLPADHASRRGSAGQAHMPPNTAAPVPQDPASAWSSFMQAGPEAYHALVAPCVAPQPHYVPPEHLVYYELAATPHLGPDGQFRKARVRYQAFPYPATAPVATDPLQPLDQNTLGVGMPYAAPPPPAATYVPTSMPPTMFIPAEPAQTYPPYDSAAHAASWQPYVGQPMQTDTNYMQPMPGQFANAGPPGWMYDPNLQAAAAATPQQDLSHWLNIALDGLPGAASTPAPPSAFEHEHGHHQHAQLRQPPMTATGSYHANRLSTGSEELFGFEGSSSHMAAMAAGADLDSAWRTRSEWSSPNPAWIMHPHAFDGYRQGGYVDATTVTQ